MDGCRGSIVKEYGAGQRQGESAMAKPPLPPFTAETAAQKVRAAEDAWNGRNPQAVSLAYTEDSRWRNRCEFLHGRTEIVAFLTRKWARELDYRLIKELWAFTGNRIAVRFAYEWHDDSGQWFRSYGNENWEFGADGLMERRFSCINDMPIKDSLHHLVLPAREEVVEAALAKAGRLRQHGQARALEAMLAKCFCQGRQGAFTIGEDALGGHRPRSLSEG